MHVLSKCCTRSRRAHVGSADAEYWADLCDFLPFLPWEFSLALLIFDHRTEVGCPCRAPRWLLVARRPGKGGSGWFPEVPLPKI